MRGLRVALFRPPPGVEAVSPGPTALPAPPVCYSVSAAPPCCTRSCLRRPWMNENADLFLVSFVLNFVLSSRPHTSDRTAAYSLLIPCVLADRPCVTYALFDAWQAHGQGAEEVPGGARTNSRRRRRRSPSIITPVFPGAPPHADGKVISHKKCIGIGCAYFASKHGIAGVCGPVRMNGGCVRAGANACAARACMLTCFASFCCRYELFELAGGTLRQKRPCPRGAMRCSTR